MLEYPFHVLHSVKKKKGRKVLCGEGAEPLESREKKGRTERVFKAEMSRILWGGEKTRGWSVLVSCDASHFIPPHSYCYTHTRAAKALLVSIPLQALSSCVSLQRPTCSSILSLRLFCVKWPSSLPLQPENNQPTQGRQLLRGSSLAP